MAFSVSEIVAWCGGRVANASALGERLERIRVERPVPLPGAEAHQLAYFFSKELQSELPTTRPGILVTGEAFVQPLEASGMPLWRSSAVVACSDPYLAMAVLSERFAEALSGVGPLRRSTKSVHATAVVHPDAELGDDVRVGPHCVVESGAKIGAGTVLHAGCFVGPGATIGRDCELFPHVTLYEWTVLGDRVRIHANSTLGSDGFGYAPRRQDGRVVGHQKIYHLGRVVVGNDVEIGANCCADRGTMGDTLIGAQAKLDNQVHVGHNARVGEGAILCGGVCLAGSAVVGNYAYVGGLTGVANKVVIGDGASIGALSLITKDVPPGKTCLGSPQREYKEHFRAHALLNRLMQDKGKRGKNGSADE